MSAKKAIIVEDDPQIREALSEVVTELGFSPLSFADGAEGKERVLKGGLGLVLIDLMLPSASGADICRAVRSVDQEVPVIVISALDDEANTVLLLELGADDYITKPFRAQELRARIRCVLRRAQTRTSGDSSSELQFKGLSLNLERRKVLREDKDIALTAREFDLLALLAENPGKPFTRDEINEHLYGYHVTGYDRSVVSHIKRIRSKLEDNSAKPVYLLTARGYGYYFSDQVLLND